VYYPYNLQINFSCVLIKLIVFNMIKGNLFFWIFPSDFHFLQIGNLIVILWNAYSYYTKYLGNVRKNNVLYTSLKITRYYIELLEFLLCLGIFYIKYIIHIVANIGTYTIMCSKMYNYKYYFDILLELGLKW